MSEVSSRQSENIVSKSMYPEQIPADGYVVLESEVLLIRGLSDDRLSAGRENVAIGADNLQIVGVPSLVIQFSNEKPYAEAIILDVRQQHLAESCSPETQNTTLRPVGLRNGKPFNSRADYMVVLRAYPENADGSGKEEKIETRPFVRGEGLTIGRRREKGVLGSKALPETASSDYCTLTLEEDGTLSIKNREQIDTTTVYLPEMAPEIRDIRVTERFRRFMQRVGHRLAERTLATSDSVRVPMEAILRATGEPSKEPEGATVKSVTKTVSEAPKSGLKEREDVLNTIIDILETETYKGSGKGIDYELAIKENPNLVPLAKHAVRIGAVSNNYAVQVLRTAGWSEEGISNLLYPGMYDPKLTMETGRSRRQPATPRLNPLDTRQERDNLTRIHVANKSGGIVRSVPVARHPKV